MLDLALYSQALAPGNGTREGTLQVAGLASRTLNTPPRNRLRDSSPCILSSGIWRTQAHGNDLKGKDMAAGKKQIWAAMFFLKRVNSGKISAARKSQVLAG